MNFGILTLATPNDYRKAIGLALSAKVSNPGVPLAVACSPKVGKLLQPYFDYVIDEDRSLKGFEHKVHLDRYSPFENTFFFDSDVLLFKDLGEIVDRWQRQPYTACGGFFSDGFSTFGLDRCAVLKKINKTELVVIDGAGHAFFSRPESKKVFDLAREITSEHKEYCGDIRYADEDVMDIVMTLLDLKPASGHDFFSRYLTVTPGTIEMNAAIGQCRFIAKHSGEYFEPYMMHFASNEAPFPYAWQLRKLYSKFNVSTKGLLADALNDFYTMQILWPLKAKVKKILRR